MSGSARVGGVGLENAGALVGGDDRREGVIIPKGEAKVAEAKHGDDENDDADGEPFFDSVFLGALEARLERFLVGLVEGDGRFGGGVGSIGGGGGGGVEDRRRVGSGSFALDKATGEVFEKILKDDGGGFGVDIASFFVETFGLEVVFGLDGGERFVLEEDFDGFVVGFSGEEGFVEGFDESFDVVALLSELALEVARHTNDDDVDVLRVAKTDEGRDFLTVDWNHAVRHGDFDVSVGLGDADAFFSYI